MPEPVPEEEESTLPPPVVTEEDVAEVISVMTGVPVTKLTEGESERLIIAGDIIYRDDEKL